MWQQWTNALLGLWVVIVPFWGFTMISFTWVLMATGAAIAALALWSAFTEKTAEEAAENEAPAKAERHHSRFVWHAHA